MRCRWLRNIALGVFLCVGMLGLGLIPQEAAAAYPDRAITLIIPWPAGGATDMLVRIIASEAEKLMGQNVVAVNRVGAVSEILINTPGTPAATATTFDGYPLAKKGLAGKAIGMAQVVSFAGLLISWFMLITIAPLLA